MLQECRYDAACIWAEKIMQKNHSAAFVRHDAASEARSDYAYSDLSGLCDKLTKKIRHT